MVSIVNKVLSDIFHVTICKMVSNVNKVLSDVFHMTICKMVFITLTSNSNSTVLMFR